MSKISNRIAKMVKADRISTIWIIPIITLFICAWLLYVHFSEQGQKFSLLAQDASGIVAGKTVIKSRSVDVGIINKVTLSDDFKQVLIEGQINKEMLPLLKDDTVFWVVKPQIGIEGITGLNTLLSGVYIELSPGSNSEELNRDSFTLLDSPPLLPPSQEGLRITLSSEQNDSIPRGAPVLFRGFRVGYIETSTFNINKRQMEYTAFVMSPYDKLVTENVRFWKEGGVDFSLTSSGAELTIPTLDVLLAGGVSFDVPDGLSIGKTVPAFTSYNLYNNKSVITEMQYTEYTGFLLFFSESISGLSEGASVEYRGIRLGTVEKAPFFNKQMLQTNTIFSYDVPVLIHIEPQRLDTIIHQSVDLVDLIKEQQKNGLRASLKSNNLLTGSLFIDLDFYPDQKDNYNEKEAFLFGYPTIETVSGGLSQLQVSVNKLLNKLNSLPLEQTVDEANKTLAESKAMLASLNKLLASKQIQNLPEDIQNAINTLNLTLNSVAPGSDINNQMKTDLQKLSQVMDELTPLLKTLNSKSNALIFAAPQQADPQPKAKGAK